jgi:hypothetical protein
LITSGLSVAPKRSPAASSWRYGHRIPSARKPPPNVIYDPHRSTADPTLWFLYECYESKDRFNGHQSFSIWWLKRDCLIAAFVMNRPDEERQCAPEWIKSKQIISADRLKDHNRPIGEAI